VALNIGKNVQLGLLQFEYFSRDVEQ